MYMYVIMTTRPALGIKWKQLQVCIRWHHRILPYFTFTSVSLL